MEKYIVPPRLSRKHIVYGFTVWELFAILFLIVLTFFSRSPIFLPPAAIIAVVFYRPQNGDKNVALYLTVLFRYFRASQVYSLRECDHFENQ